MSKNKSGVQWYQLIDFKSVLVVLVLFFVAVTQAMITSYSGSDYVIVDLAEIPEWSGQPYVEVANNVPVITTDEAVRHAFEEYARLDDWGRCGAAFACVSQRLMPKEEAAVDSSVNPSGWVDHEYDFIEGGHVYTRSCLIGDQLTGEHDNERNIITSTVYMASEGISPFEQLAAEHVQQTDHYFLYRVQPVFHDDELVCRGVQIEGYCVDCCDEAQTDEEKLMFNVFCYNVQPGVEIDYLTGENRAAE